MPTYPLSYRITSYLKRQIAWSESVIAELETFAHSEDTKLDALLHQQAQREQEARDMAHEYNGLSHEWKKAGAMPTADQESIRALSQQAQKLTESVRVHYAEAQNIANDRARKTQAALDDLRRGQRSVTIYRPEMLVSPGFIDKKA